MALAFGDGLLYTIKCVSLNCVPELLHIIVFKTHLSRFSKDAVGKKEKEKRCLKWPDSQDD